VVEGERLIVDVSEGLLSNDEGENITAEVVNAPSDGDFVFNADGSFEFEWDDVGIVNFTYLVTNGRIRSPPATVTIGVGKEVCMCMTNV
jgi:hypothetical protein